MNPAALKKIRMIVCDLDGTLLNNTNGISEENNNAIKKLTDRGIIFTLASGRIYSSVKSFAEIIKISSPVISLDGASIKSVVDGEIIDNSKFSKAKMKKIIKLCGQYKIDYAISTDEGCFTPKKKSDQMGFTIKKIGVDITPVENIEDYIKNALEITVNSPDKIKIQYIKNKFSFPFSFKYSAKMYKSESTQTHFAEIRKKDVNKGSALIKLCRHMKIKPDECAVICDWYNDISLFKTGAVKVAVGNAIDELKNIADIVTEKTNNENAVEEFINLVLKNKS